MAAGADDAAAAFEALEGLRGGRRDLTNVYVFGEGEEVEPTAIRLQKLSVCPQRPLVPGGGRARVRSGVRH